MWAPAWARTEETFVTDGSADGSWRWDRAASVTSNAPTAPATSRAAANRSATARPIPREEPVTMAAGIRPATAPVDFGPAVRSATDFLCARAY